MKRRKLFEKEVTDMLVGSARVTLSAVYICNAEVRFSAISRLRRVMAVLVVRRKGVLVI